MIQQELNQLQIESKEKIDKPSGPQEVDAYDKF